MKAKKSYMREAQHQQFCLVEQPIKRPKVDWVSISFDKEDAVGVFQPHNDTLVISVMITNFSVHRVLVDDGSLADILFLKVYR